MRVMRPAHLPQARRFCVKAFPDTKGRLGFLDECASGKKQHAGALGLIAAEGQRLVGILCCQVLEDPVLAPGRGPVAHVDLMAVHPAFRRRGVATMMWQRMEAKLVAMGIPSVWTRSRVISAGVDLRKHSEAVVFLLKMGFQKRSDIYDMTSRLDELGLDTSCAEAELRRAGIEVKRIDYSEREALRQFLSTSFPHWAGNADRVTKDGPQLVHIACADGKIIGFAASERRWFGPIGVEPGCRLKGIGKVLLLRGLRDIRARGYKRALIGWANFPFYARSISASITRVMWQMEKRIGGE